MAGYPLIVRNRLPLLYRGFIVLWLCGVGLITWAALRDGPPEPGRLWPWIMASFWASGLFFAWWAFSRESAVLRITSPGSIHIERGKAFQRVELWTDRPRFWIEDTKDSDGDPYFKLWMDAPGGKLAIQEGHQRTMLEKLQQRIEAAVSGR